MMLMRALGKMFFLLLFVLYSLTISGQSEALVELIRGEIQALPDGTELSIGVLDDGVWVTLGYRLEGGQLVEVENEDQLFEIGSITKTFTASLIMKLVEEGALALSDPLQAHLPVRMARDSFQGSTITVRDLITHTSGLSAGPGSFTLPYLRAMLFTPRNPNRNFRAAHYYRYLEGFELDYVPGREWDYNNAGYGLLGEIIGGLNGMSWEASVQRDLFTPLGVSHSYFEIDRRNRDRFVAGITAKGKRARPWEMKFINPAGAIKSTLRDMMRYAAAQLAPPSDTLAFLAATQDPLGFRIRMPGDELWAGNAMGLGWWHNLEDEDHPFLWHGGASGGYTSFVGFSKATGTAVVVLSNISSSHPSARAANRIPIPILLGQKILRLE
ncbi:MAG: beta-lactamase family protein [Lewinella sp.]|nr:beta-lactamase family protein [Lewinella sp.]